MEFVFYMMLDDYYYLNAIFSVLFDLDVWTMATLVAFGTIKPPIVDYKGKCIQSMLQCFTKHVKKNIHNCFSFRFWFWFFSNRWMYEWLERVNFTVKQCGNELSVQLNSSVHRTVVCKHSFAELVNSSFKKILLWLWMEIFFDDG